MRKQKVLILSEGFGSGHTQAAYALAAGLKELSPNVQTKVLELGSFLNPTVAPLILSAYRLTVSASPLLVGMFYRIKYEKPVSRLTRLALHKVFYNHAAQVINQLKPDLIICTHPIPNAIVSRLKESGMNIPLLTVITDYDAHGSWVSSEVDHYLVSTDEVRKLLIQRGVNPKAIQVTGIPVHPEFWIKQDKEYVREELGLKNLPTALVMGGGWGLQLFKEELISKFMQWNDKIQFVYCMGSNEKLASKMRNQPEFQHPNITVLGFTKEISKWMDAADLLITKPGGMTCTEGLAKGLPMLFCESIPGQEDKNREYFVSHGYGQELASPEILEAWLDKISSHTASTDYNKTSIQHRQIVPVSKFEAIYEPEACAESVMNLLNSSYSTRRLNIKIHSTGQRAN